VADQMTLPLRSKEREISITRIMVQAGCSYSRGSAQDFIDDKKVHIKIENGKWILLAPNTRRITVPCEKAFYIRAGYRIRKVLVPFKKEKK
jgi:hypothetical protein